jgi:hypothetical protein
MILNSEQNSKYLLKKIPGILQLTPDFIETMKKVLLPPETAHELTLVQ